MIIVILFFAKPKPVFTMQYNFYYIDNKYKLDNIC